MEFGPLTSELKLVTVRSCQEVTPTELLLQGDLSYYREVTPTELRPRIGLSCYREVTPYRFP